MGITGFTGIRVGTLQTIVTTTAQTITPPEGTDFILLCARNHAQHITFDGTTPTSQIGFHIEKNVTYRIDIGLNTVLQIITHSGTATVYWQAFRVKRDDNA
jgi:hypothetical protein